MSDRPVIVASPSPGWKAADAAGFSRRQTLIRQHWLIRSVRVDAGLAVRTMLRGVVAAAGGAVMAGRALTFGHRRAKAAAVLVPEMAQVSARVNLKVIEVVSVPESG